MRHWRWQAVGAALGLLLAVLVCSQADALRIVRPVEPQPVWVTDAVAEDAIADALDMADHDDVACEGYGKTRDRHPTWHRRFDCIITDASSWTWWNARYRMTRWGGPVSAD